MRRSDIDAALAELYARVPAIPDCKGRCWTSCGPIDMSDRERQRLREVSIRITPRDVARRQIATYWCEALSRNGRCLAYDRRPMVCRLWGTTRDLRCPLGCQPERVLTKREGQELLLRAMHAGGSDVSDHDVDELMAHYDELQRTRIFDFLAQEGQAADQARAMLYTELPPEVTRRPR